MPRKVKQLARKSALNARAGEGSLFVVERFEQQSPRTRELAALLAKLGVPEKKVLILTHGVSEALYLSARNLPRVDVLPYTDASAYDILWADVVVVEEPALSGEPAQPFVRPFVSAARPERPVEPIRKPAKPKAEKKAAKAEAKPARKVAKPKAEKPAGAKAKATPKKPAAGKAKPRKKGGK
jgi:hypothetical protein